MRLSVMCVLAACTPPMMAPPDSGPGDAGAMDSGLPDAGAPDAGAPDGGASDAGSACGPLTTTLTRCAADPVLKAFRRGQDFSVLWTAADPSVMFDADDGLWKMWFSTVQGPTCGPQLTDPALSSVSIYYAQSPDGLSWTIQDLAPAFQTSSTSGAWDFNTVETPTVIKLPQNAPAQRFALVYSGANSQQYPDGGYILPRIQGQFAPWQLGLAFSSDGKQFTRLPAAQSPYASASLPFGARDGLVLYAGDAFPQIPGVVYGSVADPELVKVGNTFHLYFSSAGTDANANVISTSTQVAYGISHATSTDLIHWTVTPANPLIPGGGQPAVLAGDAGFEMYLSRDSQQELAAANIPSLVFPTLGFFHATSADGTTWQVDAQRELTWERDAGTEELGLLAGSAVVRVGNELRLYYGAWTNDGTPGGCALVQGPAFVPGEQVINVARKQIP